MQTKALFSWDRFEETPIVGIIRGQDLETVRQIVEIYIHAGFYTLEVTMNTIGAGAIIAELRSQFPNLNIGAGTVRNIADLELAIASGAQYIVTPIIDEEVIRRAVAQNIPIFPGAYSPTEIYKAWLLGASAVKVFPATQLGPQFLKDVAAPLNDVKMLPTGGISKENIKSFFAAGAIGVGMGSSLFDKCMIREGNYEALEIHFLQIKNEMAAFQKK